ncbi:MAG: pyridoxal phosphate-dependent aminotransferase, partial [Natronospirillum sp.]
MTRISANQRVARLSQSPIRAMTQRCNELGGVNLGQGICDTPPPRAVLDGVAPAIARGENSYTRYDGIDRLRAILARKIARYNGIHADPDTEVVATAGSTGAFTATITALLEPGDRILLFEPYYGYHYSAAQVVGLQPDTVALNPEDMTLDLSALETKASGARALVINTPGNPSGRVFTRHEMEQIADVCQRHDLLCITDEIYEYFLFDQRKHLSMATLPGMWDRTVTISGYSKAFSITGWRMGYLVAPASLSGPIGLVNDLYYVCVPSIVQHAVADAIEQLDDDFYRGLAQENQDRRDRFCSVLDEVGLTPRVPEGAYYVLADVSRLGCKSAPEAAMKLLEHVGVAGIPGSAFYQSHHGDQLIRFCFGKDDHVLE